MTLKQRLMAFWRAASKKPEAAAGGYATGSGYTIDDGVDWSGGVYSPTQKQAATLQEAPWHQVEFDQPHAGNASEKVGLPVYDLLREWDWTTRYDIITRCHQVWERNPLAKAAVNLTRQFAVSTGVTVSTRAAEVKEVIDAFMKESKANVIDKGMCDSLQLDGEVFVRLFNRGGKTVIRFVKPWDVQGIETEEDDTQTITGYSLSNGKTVKPDEIVHVKINALPYELRGRPELVPVLAWLKAYKDWLEDRFRQNRRRSAAWDVTLKNATAAQVSTKRTQYREPPPPGSILVHNENEVWQAIEQKIAAGDVAEDGRQFKIMVAVGVGLPEVYLSDGANANMACYDDLTEVLTNRGWLRHESLVPDDYVMQYNPETKLAEWVKPLAEHNYRYVGEMYHFSSKNMDICVTPNHRMWLRFDRVGLRDSWLIDRTGDFRVISAAETKGHSGDRRWVALGAVRVGGDCQEKFVIPGCKRKTCEDIADCLIDMNTWLEFLGYFVSEGGLSGTVAGRHRVYIGQRKPDGVRAIDTLMQKLPWHVYRYNDKTGSVHWSINDKALFLWLGENCGKYAGEKRLPVFVSTLSYEQRLILLNALILGDGSVAKNHSGSTMVRYYSCSGRLIDDVQALAVGCGYVACVLKPHNDDRRIGFASQTMHTVSMHRQTEQHLRKIDVIGYDGDVWCLEVPSGIYVTRRKGKVAIQGNSATAQGLPALMKFKDFQDVMKEMWLAVLRAVVEHAVAGGLVPEECVQVDGDGDPIKDKDGKEKKVKAVDAFDVQYPALTESDPKTLAEALQIDVANGWCANATAASKRGYDPLVEKKKIVEEQAEAQAMQAAQQPELPPEEEQPEPEQGGVPEQDEEKPLLRVKGNKAEAIEKKPVKESEVGEGHPFPLRLVVRKN